jgi:3D (Asp-Asp-Asp) domain-containing protein
MKKIQNIAISIIGLTIFIASLSIIGLENNKIYGKESTAKENSFVSMENPIIITEEKKVKKTIKVVITAYSSCPLETDDTPFLTANGSEVKEGIVANNLLPFGTEIRIPELYGNKVFVVQDRMNSKKGYYHVDIWFPSKKQAIDFGAVQTYIEILKS